MIALFIFFQSVSAILLITVILMQSGRGGGLTESFASAESMFGAKTNEFMVRATVILSGVFLVTSLILAHLSSKKDRSLIPDSGLMQTKSMPYQPKADPKAVSPTANIPANKM